MDYMLAILDDEPDICSLLEAALSELPKRKVFVGTGVDFVYHKVTADVILTDFFMPAVTGLAAVYDMIGRGHTPKGVVFLSGYGIEGHSDLIELAGTIPHVHVVPKPDLADAVLRTRLILGGL